MVLMVDGDDDNRGTAVLTAIAGCRASDGIRYLRSGAAIVWGYLYFYYTRHLKCGFVVLELGRRRRYRLRMDVAMREQIMYDMVS